MKKLILLLVILNATHVFAQNFYITNMLNIPLMRDKGEFKWILYGGNEGVGTQFSYALTGHLVFFGNISNYNNNGGNQSSSGTSPYGSSQNFEEHTMADIGCGYFKKIGTRGVFEISGGIGYGSANISGIKNNGNLISDDTISPFLRLITLDFFNIPPGHYEQITQYVISGNYLKAFVQPSIGLAGKKHRFNAGIGVRINQIFYNNITSGFTTKDSFNRITKSYDRTVYENHYDMGNGSLFAEPCFTMDAGFKNIKFHTAIYWTFQGNQQGSISASAGLCIGIFDTKNP